MPELPEVTLTATSLNDQCEGWTLTQIEVHKSLKTMVMDLLNDSYNIRPLTITRVWNRGKYIIFDLNNNLGSYNIVSHMMLAGHWSLKQIQSRYITLTLSNSNSTKEIHYCDNQGIGSFYFIRSNELDSLIGDIKPSVFDNLTASEFVIGMRKHNRSMIFNIIMDQKKVLSGVGNYVANESLHRAGIHPRCVIRNISDDFLDKLYWCIVHVCNESYKYGGVSIKDYLNIHDEKGNYQNYLLVFHRDYDSDGYMVVKDKLSGRSVYWVEEKILAR